MENSCDPSHYFIMHNEMLQHGAGLLKNSTLFTVFPTVLQETKRERNSAVQSEFSKFLVGENVIGTNAFYKSSFCWFCAKRECAFRKIGVADGFELQSHRSWNSVHEYRNKDLSIYKRTT